MPGETLVLDERGRVTLPAWLRRRLGLKPGSKLEVRVENGRIVLTPLRRLRARDLLGAAGVEEVEIEEVEAALGDTS